MSSYDREEVARARKLFPLRTMTVSVDQFFKLLADEQRTGNGDLPDDLSSPVNLVEYLNKLSEAIREEQHTRERIVFCLSESKLEEEYYTGIRYRPDFVAIKIGPEANPPSLMTIERKVTDLPQSNQDHEGIWSQLETTGGMYSRGAASVVQSASYTGHLLQARPDLVSVVGLFFHPERSQFRVYFTDAWGVCQTEAVNFNSSDTVPLLKAYIRHIYNPEARLNIRRCGNFPSKPTFTIDTNTHEQFMGCVLLRVGLPFHRRSAIFAVPQSSSPPTQVVIKLQYVEKGRQFEEGPILRRIHESYDFPGVVRLVPVTGAMQGPATVEAGSEAFAGSSRGFAANTDGEERVAQVRDECPDADMTEKAPAVEEAVSDAREEETAPDINNATSNMDVGVEWPHNRRNKDTRETLLVLQDKADLLADAETPLEALIAFYDLLEVTRFLHKYRKIFHRDISAGNVLLREKSWTSVKAFENKFGDMCFASHLLGEKGPDPNASRLHTRVLLIDFDMAEDRGSQRRQQSTDRSGTPMFMARLVRSPVVCEGTYVHRAMPQLQGFTLERYKACVSSRLSEFPKNDKSTCDIEEAKNIKYSHRLSYEAESTMWLLFSWAMQVKPRKKCPDNQIPEHLWANLTGGEGPTDPRGYFVTVPSFSREAVCHPVYQGFDKLLFSLGAQLSGYQEQVALPSNEQEPSRRKDEYLHEAFQRTIFDFIVKNIEEPFMREPISHTRRRRQLGAVMSQYKVTPSIGDKRGWEAMAGAGSQSSGQPNLIRPNPPTENPTFN